jgi:hypothetical protein
MAIKLRVIDVPAVSGAANIEYTTTPIADIAIAHAIFPVALIRTTFFTRSPSISIISSPF